jgi:hypothetical protein
MNPTRRETRSAVVTFSVDLTPTKGLVSIDSRRDAVDGFGLGAARTVLLRDAARLDRLADRNERAGLQNGANSKRRRAAARRHAADLLADITRQIMACGR